MTPNKLLLCVVVAFCASAVADAQASGAGLLIELENALPRRAPSQTGQVATGLPDWEKAADKVGAILTRATGTLAEPQALFQLGNCFFGADRIEEAQATFDDLKTRFPSHPLVTKVMEVDGLSAVNQALSDCHDELAFRSKHPVRTLPRPELDPEGVATLHLTVGKVKIRFYKNVAAEHRKNFVKLARDGYYDLSRVHRVVAGTEVQMGDPNSKTQNLQEWGKGGPAHNIENEFSLVTHKKGTVTMFRGPGKLKSHGSQFQILLQDQPHRDFVQTPFAEVIEGIELIEELSRVQRNQFEAPVADCFIVAITFGT